jgi:hypothetical protein
VKLDGTPLDASEYRWYMAEDNAAEPSKLILWVNRDIERDTAFEIAP